MKISHLVKGFTFFLLMHYSQAKAQSLYIDSSFGGDGKVTTNLESVTSNKDGEIKRLFIQADGKIVAVGSWVIDKQTDYDFVLIRYNKDGSVDESYGNQGVSITDISGIQNFVRSAAIQKDEKIIVAGSTDNQTILIRYTRKGEVDSSFGNNGVVRTTKFGNSVVIQGDGKIVLAGAEDSTGLQVWAIRYNPNGTLDPGFGKNGYATIVYKGYQVGPVRNGDVGIQSDGRIVITFFSVKPGFSNNFSVMRFTQTGIPDSTFGTNSLTTTDFKNNSFDRPSRIIIKPDDNIMTAGESQESFFSNFALCAYTKNGKTDSSFGTNGTVVSLFANERDFFNSYIADIALQTDGKIVAVGGVASFFLDWRFALMRYNPDGSPDKTFGTNGQMITHFEKTEEAAAAVAIQRDGKIIAGGYSNRIGIFGTDENIFALSRYFKKRRRPIPTPIVHQTSEVYYQ